MLLKQIISKVDVIKTVGDLNLDITNINSDSRKISNGGLFFAINGFSQDGLSFVPNSIENGAIAIIVEPSVNIDSLDYKDCTIIQVIHLLNQTSR